jgi:hypothetical protein
VYIVSSAPVTPEPQVVGVYGAVVTLTARAVNGSTAMAKPLDLTVELVTV